MVKLWTVRTSECIATYDKHEDKVLSSLSLSLFLICFCILLLKYYYLWSLHPVKVYASLVDYLHTIEEALNPCASDFLWMS